MKVHYDVNTGRVTGYTTFGNAPVNSLDLGESINYDFIYPLDEYSVINDTIVHSGVSPEKLNTLKTAKLSDLENHFINVENNTGTLFSTVSNINIHARRKDKDNMLSLINYMNRNSLTTMVFKGVGSESADVTVTDMQNMVAEIEDYGITLYATKWQLESAIMAATTEAELDAITW